jgi:hypothetical protein
MPPKSGHSRPVDGGGQPVSLLAVCLDLHFKTIQLDWIEHYTFISIGLDIHLLVLDGTLDI